MHILWVLKKYRMHFFIFWWGCEHVNSYINVLIFGFPAASSARAGEGGAVCRFEEAPPEEGHGGVPGPGASLPLPALPEQRPASPDGGLRVQLRLPPGNLGTGLRHRRRHRRTTRWMDARLRERNGFIGRRNRPQNNEEWIFLSFSQGSSVAAGAAGPRGDPAPGVKGHGSEAATTPPPAEVATSAPDCGWRGSRVRTPTSTSYSEDTNKSSLQWDWCLAVGDFLQPKSD